MPDNVYSRKMSYNERMFIAADELCPPLNNQLFFDGTGFFDVTRWRSAVKIASGANPGSRLVLKGYLGGSRWVDSGVTPEVIEIDGRNWDGHSPDNAPFLMKRFNPATGPTSEVLLIRGNTLRVCFRSMHAVMDGRGTLTWAEDIFRVLRGEEPAGSSSTLTDYELVRSVRRDYRKPFPRNSIAPTGNPESSEDGVTWRRIKIQGRFRNLLGQLLFLAANEAWKHQEGPVHFSIPVDLRSRIPGTRSTGNLSIAIYVEVRQDSTPESLTQDIRSQLEEKHDCLIDKGDYLITHLPLKLLVNRGRSMIKKVNSSGRYGTSGAFSHMGQVPLDVFSGGAFTATTFWGIPPGFETIPFFLGSACAEDSIEIILTMPAALASNGRLEQVLNNISTGLRKS